MEITSSGCYVIDDDFNVINVNQTAKDIYPQLEVGRKCYTCLLGLDKPCGPCPVVNGRKGPNIYTDPIRGISEMVDAVDMEIAGAGSCHALIFSTVGSREALAATLPTDADTLTNLDIIKALTVDYYDVFEVDLKQEKITLYRHDRRPIEPDSVYKNILSYEEGIENYVKRHVVEEDREQFRIHNSIPYIKEHLQMSESFNVHYRVSISGEVHYFFRKIARVGNADDFSSVIVGVSCEDDEINSRIYSETLEKNLAEIEYDNLTGLYTKEAFMVRGEELLRSHPDTSYDFCISNIENLLMINHQYGRAAGDKLISLVGRLLKGYEADNNCITYLGDGRFASFTINEPRESRKAAVMAFRDEITRLSEIKGVSLKWSIYTNVPAGMSIDDIIDKTNYALATIRQSIYQDYVEFDRTVIDKMDREGAIEKNFEKALANGEFAAWYQPKYSIKTGKIIGAEALARWKKPDGSMISPGEFVPVLEKSGKIRRLDEHIFGLVCDMQERLKEEGIDDIPISVNLSRASMYAEDIADKYSEIAKQKCVDKESIPIEITESAAVRASVIGNLADELIAKGFKLHMDDFGSGYSSLASLQVISFDSIKLDKSLIDFIGRESSDSLLKHTIAFAKESGKHVVAEGVENYEQYLFLKVAGCDAVQGYYFSKPVEEEIFMDMLRKDRQELQNS